MEHKTRKVPSGGFDRRFRFLNRRAVSLRCRASLPKISGIEWCRSLNQFGSCDLLPMEFRQRNTLAMAGLIPCANGVRTESSDASDWVVPVHRQQDPRVSRCANPSKLLEGLALARAWVFESPLSHQQHTAISKGRALSRCQACCQTAKPCRFVDRSSSAASVKATVNRHM